MWRTATSAVSGDDQFFEGILSRTIELNREANPYPELTVVRGLILVAGELSFKIGPRLAGYIGEVGASMNEDVVERIQADHYGQIRVSNRALHDSITKMVRRTRNRERGQLSGTGTVILGSTSVRRVEPANATSTGQRSSSG